MKRLSDLEMKDRVQLIADELIRVLPEDASERCAILHGMLHPEVKTSLDQTSDRRGIAGWGIWPLSLVVAQHGLDTFDESMELLREMTRRSTAEFAVRYFLIADQTRALRIMKAWTGDECHHVRRLASEGSRPRLPWGMQLPQLMRNPKPTLPLLKALRDDESAYVRRSVANHLNDISKDNPTICLETAAQWLKAAPATRRSLLKHGCRGLIKAGDPQALSLFGILPPKLAPVRPSLSASTIRIGENLTLSADIQSMCDAPQRLEIDYLVHFLRANGTRSAKVFKGARWTLNAFETRTFARRHSFKPVTTRRLYPGEQAISLRINGVDSEALAFELLS